MKIVRVYTGDDGRSHFDDMDIDVSLKSEWGRVSELYEGEGVIFRTSPADYDADFHNAPRRQFVVILEGKMEVETGDGSKRLLEPGGILLGDDLTGQGHITRAMGGVPGRSLIIPLK